MKLSELLENVGGQGGRVKHPTVPLELGGKVVNVDVKMVPLIRALWDAGFHTSFCCQGDDGSEGFPAKGYVSFPVWSRELYAVVNNVNDLLERSSGFFNDLDVLYKRNNAIYWDGANTDRVVAAFVKVLIR